MRIKDEIKGPGIARLGIIKIGEKRLSEKTGKEYPVSLDYFKATGRNLNIFHNAYGEKPSSIRIVFISDDDNACNEVIEYRQGRSLIAEGDGEIFRVWKRESKEYIAISILEYEKNGKNFKNDVEKKFPDGKWKRIARLKFIILEPEKNIGIGNMWGYWEFTTAGEKSSIKNIISAFDSSRERMNGKVMSTIFSLCVEKVTSNTPGEKKEDKRIYPVVTLIPMYNQRQVEYINSELLQIEAPK